MEGSGGPGGTPNNGKGDDNRDGRYIIGILLWKDGGLRIFKSFEDLVFVSERIDVGPKRGKFDYFIRTTEKTGVNKEGEDEGEIQFVTVISVRLSFLLI